MGAQFWWIGSRFTDRRENMTAATLLGCTNRPKSRVTEFTSGLWLTQLPNTCPTEFANHERFDIISANPRS